MKLKHGGNIVITIKRVSNIIFLIISCLVIANLLIRMVDKPFLKIIFVVIAVGLDLFRQYVVMMAKYYWRIAWIKSVGLWLVYIAHFSIVIIASAGFTLSEVNAKSQESGLYNMEKQSIISTIKSNESEIKQLETLRKTLNPAEWEFRRVSSRIDVLQKANVGHYEKLGNFKEAKLDVQEDVFNSIGSGIHIAGEFLKLYVFIVIAILIELALLITSWSKDEMSIDSKLQQIEPILPVSQPVSSITETDNDTQVTHNVTQKMCPYCLKLFTPKKSNQIYCQDNCRVNAFRNRAMPKELEG